MEQLIPSPDDASVPLEVVLMRTTLSLSTNGKAEAFRHSIRIVADVASAGSLSCDRDMSRSLSKAASPRS